MTGESSMWLVVLFASQDLELTHKHLSVNETYQLLQNDAIQEIITQFTEYLRTCKEQEVITRHEYYRLLLSRKVDTQ